MSTDIWTLAARAKTARDALTAARGREGMTGPEIGYLMREASRARAAYAIAVARHVFAVVQSGRT